MLLDFPSVAATREPSIKHSYVNQAHCPQLEDKAQHLTYTITVAPSAHARTASETLMFTILLAFRELENDIDELNQTKLSIKADDVIRLSVSMFRTMDLSGPPFSQYDDDSGPVYPNSKCLIRDRTS